MGRSWPARIALVAAWLAILSALGSAGLYGLMAAKRGADDPVGLALLLAAVMFGASGGLFYLLSRPRRG